MATTRRQNFLIGVLSVSAVLLTIGHLQLATPARANVEVSQDDYQLITARMIRGTDGVYILDRRRNMVAVFVWDQTARRIVPRDVKSLDVLMAP